MKPQAAVAAKPKRRLPLAVLLGFMFLAGLCALLALNTASAALEVQQRGLTAANASTSDSEQQLLRDLAAKQAPSALAAAASALGLVPNQNPAFLRVNQNGSVTVLGSPVPASAPPKPTVTPKPTATPKPTTTPKPTATPTAKVTRKPSVAAPVVTVTVTKSVTASTTKSAPPASAPAGPNSHPSSTAPGGH
jgi:hypothetical protein